MSAKILRFVSFLAGAVAVFSLGLLYSEERDPGRPQLSAMQGWGKKFAHQKRQLVSGPVDALFVGDSLTEFWGSTGKAIWDLEFHEMNAVNFGIAGDRTENILFRLMHSDLSSRAPRVIVVLAGTNNLSQEPPDTPRETAEAIRSILEYLNQTCPKSRIYGLTLPPNGSDSQSHLRSSIKETNRRLKTLPLPENVSLIDIYPTFVDSAHRWKPGLTLDGTHLSQQGYDRLAEAIRPVFEAAKQSSK